MHEDATQHIQHEPFCRPSDRTSGAAEGREIPQCGPPTRRDRRAMVDGSHLVKHGADFGDVSNYQ